VSATAAKQRLDIAVTERGLSDTRSRARALILAGDVLVNGTAESHAGSMVRPEDEIELRGRPRFVSRGGEKLDHAIATFDIAVEGLVCADLGASTGGFTDCLLQRGASRVYAIDVGYGQIDDGLRRDERVVVMERVNARYLESLPEPVDLVVIDVSFISLSLILPVAAQLLTGEGTCVPLIKPQFEAGRKDVGKGGVVRDPAVHERVLREFAASATANEFSMLDLVRSPLLGPSGNVEFLAHLRRGGAVSSSNQDELSAKVVAGE
jgi:23S rRNA (cytidine1920-2'-O)/16S rRNA (cytidine1409-2'-O)-methyltransferase